MMVGTGKAREAENILVALERGRQDHQYFSWRFLKRKLHRGQLLYVANASATINVLATANRYGKTTVLSHVHTHANVYKTGGEPRYIDPVTGAVDQEAFLRLKYNTIHTADDLETALLVWDEERKIIGESPELKALVKADPLTKPPYIEFINGSRWRFRTLGDDASGIDGNSFYVISIDEAGWIKKLEEKMDNVIRVRVADVSGVIHIVGTFKPGISKDFYKYAVRASAYTGQGLTFDHGSEEDEGVVTDGGQLDAAIVSYLRDFIADWKERGVEFNDELRANLAQLGITPDEYADAATRGA